MNKLFGFVFALVLIVSFGSCKPKQSAYKSVYEAAKEREIEENNKPATVTKPAYPAYTPSETSPIDEKVTQEKIKTVYPSDASALKAYSVVIASLGVKPNAEALKTKMENEGYKIILAQNEEGLYRVIIASYDDKESAIAKRNEIRNKYGAKGTAVALKRTYGIPFNDLWILLRQY